MHCLAYNVFHFRMTKYEWVRGEAFSHLRADTECLASVEPVMTAFSSGHPDGNFVN